MYCAIAKLLQKGGNANPGRMRHEFGVAFWAVFGTSG